MAWNMKDYPASLKNFSKLERKKAIDIANALLEEGYDEDQAIPIATSQMKKWFDDASDAELEKFKKEANPKKTDKHEGTMDKSLINANVEIRPVEDGWEVKTVGAEKAFRICPTKVEALERAKEVARNKGSKVYIYSLEDKFQKSVKPISKSK